MMDGAAWRRYFCRMMVFVDGVECSMMVTINAPLGCLFNFRYTQILVANWDGALTLLRELKSCIEFTNAPPLEQLQQRSWLLHWSLFVFFNHANGR